MDVHPNISLMHKAIANLHKIPRDFALTTGKYMKCN